MVQVDIIANVVRIPHPSSITQCRTAGDEPTAFAVSLNDRRRHMNMGSRAAVSVDLEPFFAEDAKRRQKLSIKARDEKGRAAPVMAILPQVVQEKPAPVARNEAAKSVGVGERYVQDAKKIRTEAPEVFQRLKAGTITLQDAKREVAKKPTDDWRKDKRERQAKRLCCMMPRLKPELPPQATHQFRRIASNP